MSKMQFSVPEPWLMDLAQKLSSKGFVIADLNFTPGPDFQNRALNHRDAEVRRESAKWFRHAVDFAVHVDAAHIIALLRGGHALAEEVAAVQVFPVAMKLHLRDRTPGCQ
jgi:hypothetical protein